MGKPNELKNFCIFPMCKTAINNTNVSLRRRKLSNNTKKGKIGITPPSSPTSTFSSSPQNGYHNRSFQASPRLHSDSSDYSDGAISGQFKFLDEPEVFTISNGGSDTLSTKGSKKSHISLDNVKDGKGGIDGSFPEDKYQWNDTDVTDGQTLKKTKSRKILCIVLVTLLVIAILAGVAVILALKVFKVGEDDPLPVVRPEVLTLEGWLDLRDTWTPVLANSSSPLYKSTAENFTAEMDLLMKNSSFSETYIETEVLGFSKGSIKVDYRMRFNEKYKLKDPVVPRFAVLVEEHVKRAAPRSNLPIDVKTVNIAVPNTTTEVPSTMLTSSEITLSASTPSTITTAILSSSLSTTSSSEISSATSTLSMITASISSSLISSSSSEQLISSSSTIPSLSTSIFTSSPMLTLSDLSTSELMSSTSIITSTFSESGTYSSSVSSTAMTETLKPSVYSSTPILIYPSSSIATVTSSTLLSSIPILITSKTYIEPLTSWTLLYSTPTFSSPSSSLETETQSTVISTTPALFTSSSSIGNLPTSVELSTSQVPSLNSSTSTVQLSTSTPTLISSSLSEESVLSSTVQLSYSTSTLIPSSLSEESVLSSTVQLSTSTPTLISSSFSEESVSASTVIVSTSNLSLASTIESLSLSISLSSSESILSTFLISESRLTIEPSSTSSLQSLSSVNTISDTSSTVESTLANPSSMSAFISSTVQPSSQSVSSTETLLSSVSPTIPLTFLSLSVSETSIPSEISSTLSTLTSSVLPSSSYSVTTSSVEITTPTTPTTTGRDYPPVANADKDITLTLPENSVQLNGYGSTDDYGIVRYRWRLTSQQSPVVDMAGLNTATLTLRNLVSGTFTFELTVTDRIGQTSTDFVVVHVQPASTTTTTTTPTTTLAKCTTVTFAPCAQRGFVNTVFPNLFGHNTSHAAENAFNKTVADIHNQICQEVALHYVCSLYFPKCDVTTGAQRYPCNSLCKAAVTTCDDYFPNPAPCYYFVDDGDCVDVPPTTVPTTTTTKKPLTCEPTTFNTCKDLGFNYTKFPNAWGEPDQSGAKETFNSYFLPYKQCHKDFMYFMCSVQFSLCDNGAIKSPCRRLCNEVLGNCTDAISFITCDGYQEIDCIAPVQPKAECRSTQFSCGKVSKCISADKVCNGQNDCDDWTDEMECTCSQYEFQCDMGMCIKSYQQCDSVAQCPDNSDEANCEHGCTHGQIKCPNDGPNITCIMSEWMCDGRMECKDGWDEQNCNMCPRGKFQCKDNSCIDIRKRCDGVNDCPAGYDEWNCIQKTDGIIEVAYKNYWLPVCVHSWKDAMGETLCRDILGQGAYLGYNSIYHNVWSFADITPTGNIPTVLGNINITADCQNYMALRVNCEPKGCGERVLNQKPFIVGGEISSPGDWPWHVALYVGNQYFCGGTLINRNWVMTAAHCVESHVTDFSLLTVKIGANNRKRQEVTQRVVRVEAIESHKEHVMFERNDIALLQLASSVNYTNYIQPVCLPTADEPLPLYSECYTIGWGKTKYDGDYATVLQQLKMKLWDTKKCNSSVAWNGEIYDTTICAGYYSGIRSICNGDSGGPLLCLTKQKLWKPFGISSYVANYCNMTERPNIFADVKHFIPWIEEKIECKFLCDNGKCLYKREYMCDRIDHCGDNSDEIKPCNRTVACDFEDKYLCGYEFSGWKLGYDNKLAASIIIDGQTHTQSFAPQFDHTVGRYPGHFFYGKQKEVKDALLWSPKFTTTSQTCIRFSYYLRGQIKFGLDVTLYEFSSSGRNVSKLVWSSGDFMSGSDEWKMAYFDITFGEFQLKFETGDLLKAAIDDVQMLQGFCSVELCDPSQDFRCRSNRGLDDNCIPKQSQCNLAIDCGEQDDEATCTASTDYVCTFENGNLCALRQAVGDSSDWWLVDATFVQADTKRKDILDHTFNTKTGHMFYINLYGIQASSYMGQQFYLHNRQYCLSFYYQLESAIVFNINLECPGCTKRTVRAHGTYNSWTLYQVNLPIANVVNVTYDVTGPQETNSNVFYSYVALDDITVKPGTCPSFTCPPSYTKCQTADHCVPQDRLCDRVSNCPDESDESNCVCTAEEFKCLSGRCIPKAQMCDKKTHCLDGSDEGSVCESLKSVSCDFEQAFMCGYEFVHHTSYHWHRMKGSTPTIYTGPKTDHTFGNALGYYVYAEANEGSRGDNATLESPQFQSGFGKSIEFYYHIYSYQPALYQAGKLQLSISTGNQERVLWSSDNVLLDTWRRVCVNLPDGITGKAWFTAIRNEPFNAVYGVDMAVDDIKLNGFSCGDATSPSPTLPPVTGTSPSSGCKAGHVKCKTGSVCVPQSYWCDQEDDCPDGSDETDCAGK